MDSSGVPAFSLYCYLYSQDTTSLLSISSILHSYGHIPDWIKCPGHYFEIYTFLTSAICSLLKWMSEVSCHFVSVLMRTTLISLKCFHPNSLQDFPVLPVFFKCVNLSFSLERCVGELMILFVPIIILLIAFSGFAAYFVNRVSTLNQGLESCYSLHIENSISAFAGNSISEVIRWDVLLYFNRLSACTSEI